MKNIIAIGVGGAIGTYLRYFINIQSFSLDYPAGTLIENLLGSLLLGVLSGYFIMMKPKEWVKAGLGVGLCGGFTTFSTFASDTVWLSFNVEIWLVLLFYIIPTLLGGILFGAAGFLLGQKIGGKRV